jgi:hypothetical protein
VFSETYGGEALKKSSVFKRHKRFEKDRENVEGDERSGYPRCHRTDGNVEKVRNFAHSNGRLSFRAMAVQLN